eukprot:642025-Pyramimonas_sp.AAC.2
MFRSHLAGARRPLRTGGCDSVRTLGSRGPAASPAKRTIAGPMSETCLGRSRGGHKGVQRGSQGGPEG